MGHPVGGDASESLAEPEEIVVHEGEAGEARPYEP